MMFDLVDRISAYEDGTATAYEALELFAFLIRTGQAWTLQGFYGRAAASLIEGGEITPEGEITQEAREWAATVDDH